MKKKFSFGFFSLKILIPLDMPSDPASGLGQITIVGKLTFFAALSVVKICDILFSYSVVTGCCEIIKKFFFNENLLPTPCLKISFSFILFLFFKIFFTKSIRGQPTLKTYLGSSPNLITLSRAYLYIATCKCINQCCSNATCNDVIFRIKKPFP